MRKLTLIGALAIVTFMSLSVSAFAAQSCEAICVADCAKNASSGAGVRQPRCVQSCYQKRGGTK
jgi:hypothetical protein